MRNPIALVVLVLAAAALGVSTPLGLRAREQARNSVVLQQLIETDDWNEVGTRFDRMDEASPELMTQPFGFAGHTDLAMRELPLD